MTTYALELIAIAEGEVFHHDPCPECNTPSVPCEGVPDQTLRGCPECSHVWVEGGDEL